MNNLKLIFPLLFLIASCNTIGTESNNSSTTKDPISRSIKKAEVLNESELSKSEASKEISAKEQVIHFNDWFMVQNKPFVNLADSVANTISLDEGEEWDGRIPNFNQRKNNVLLIAKKSIETSTDFTDAYKNKLIRLLSAPKPKDYVLNLPSTLLQNESAFHLSGVFFDQVYNVEKRQAELGKDSRIIDLSKRYIPNNSKLILCNTGYTTATEGNSVILVFIQENGTWKISDIFFESELFQ